MKKSIMLSAALLLASGSVASAQGLSCQRPAAPVIAVGAESDLLQMQASRDTVGIYMETMKLYLDCLANEHENARIEANTILDQLEAETRSYNEK